MLRMFRLVLVVSCLLGALPVHAQQSGQDPRVAEAKTACGAGNVQKGVELLAELYTATNDPIWIFNQARCYHQNNQLGLALARFKEFLRKSKGGPDEDIREAQAYINEIETDLRKNEVSSASQPSAPAPATPVPAQAVSTVPASPDSHHGRGLRYTGIAAGVLGGAAMVGGVVFSILVQQTKQDVENQTKNSVVPASAVSGKLSDGRTYESLQWVCYGVGAAAVLTGALLYYFGARASETTSVSTTQFTPLLVAKGAGAGLRVPF